MSADRFLPFDALPFLTNGRSPATIASAVRTGERVFFSGRSALRPDGTVAGLGDPVAQAHVAMDQIEAALAAAGGTLSDITKLTTAIIDRAHRKPVYDVIGQRLRGVFPVSTGLVVAGLPLPELMVQIDAEATIGAPAQRIRTFGLNQWFGQLD
jgi:enamine deaminase RidA (YjgF/YER057c/UK114 family)